MLVHWNFYVKAEETYQNYSRNGWYTIKIASNHQLYTCILPVKNRLIVVFLFLLIFLCHCSNMKCQNEIHLSYWYNSWVLSLTISLDCLPATHNVRRFHTQQKKSASVCCCRLILLFHSLLQYLGITIYEKLIVKWWQITSEFEIYK